MSNTASKVDELVKAGNFSAQNADELFSFVSLLEDEYVLRRALTDPAFDTDQLGKLLHKLLGGKLENTTIDLISQIAGIGCASGQELAGALDRAGAVILFRQAESNGKLDDVREELFKFGRLVSGNTKLRQIFSDSAVDRSAKEQLITELLGEKVTPETRALARRAVYQQTRSYELAIRRYLDIASDMRGHECARVQVARPLTDEQQAKLVMQLTRIYGVAVDLEIEVNPRVVGGVRVEIADEVIDGSLISRINEAQRSIG